MLIKCLRFAMVLALVAAPLCAAGGVVPAGLDLWRTPGDGSTYTDFAENPLPAGFFCDESLPFSGRIVFEGVPVATDKRGGLGSTDTIVQRLDDARFNARGVATTRVQMKALSFASVSPVRTECGLYNVMASLDGPQPVTRMRIVRTGEDGGFFIAPVSLAVKLTFTPVAGPARETREVVQVVQFNRNPRYAWTDAQVERPRRGKVVVDTDGDLEPDTVLRLGGRLATPAKASTCHCDSTQSFSSLSLEKAEALQAATICQHIHCPYYVAD
jgi:hypothetical protein